MNRPENDPVPDVSPDAFSTRLLRWFDTHGRHHLPWQHPRTPYRVWVAEIMLQQTRVETVLPYYQAFMVRFPDLQTLAEAPLDPVLHRWSGLGYYARARHLHATAQRLHREYAGVWPTQRAALERLPGIGRSTAAAILAQAFEQREAILDGNCRRVFARHLGITGWTGSPQVQAQLWQAAEARLPQARLADYTQALMDLGATVCTRSRPSCTDCPIASDCRALLENRVQELPSPRPRRPLPERIRYAALVEGPDGLWLQRRPPSGLWGGLFSLPEARDPARLAAWVEGQWPTVVALPCTHAPIRQVFSHYRLELHLRCFRVPTQFSGVMEGHSGIWYKSALAELPAVGLPAPIQQFLLTRQAT